jgi:uncharacterized protein YjlB
MRVKDKVDAYVLRDDGQIPNNERLPLLIYRGVLGLRSKDPAADCQKLFARHKWGNGWRNGIYNYHHFHATTHEVLGITRGQANVRFGGEQGVLIEVCAGDVVVIPAGVGHRNEGSSADLEVVGAYPENHEPDICTGDGSERDRALKALAHVPLPNADPVFGAEGPLFDRWK